MTSNLSTNDERRLTTLEVTIKGMDRKLDEISTEQKEQRAMFNKSRGVVWFLGASAATVAFVSTQASTIKQWFS